MIQGQSVLAVVPARGGSKGVKEKNLTVVGDKTLIEHVAHVIRACAWIDAAVVSTDYDSIKEEARRAGLEVPFTRPGSLSGDRVPDIDVLRHAVTESETYYGRSFDIVIMLQPTSPLRQPRHVTCCVKKMIDARTDSCITLSETDPKHHPLKQLCLDGDRVAYYDPRGEKIIARQMLAPVYHRNGICYAFTRACLMEKGKLITDNSSAVVTDDFTVNIDTLYDVRLAELYLRGVFQG